jgi:hypothetical protein
LIASAQPLQAVGPFTVVDVSAKKVGTLFDPSTGVFFNLNGRLFSVRVAQEGFFTRTRVYFESTDCSGAPHADRSRLGDTFGTTATKLVPEAALAPPGHTAYIPDLSSAPTTITVMSQSTPSGSCETTGPYSNDLLPVVRLVNLDAVFTPPLSIGPSTETCGDCDGSGTVTANEITRVISNVFGENAGPSAQ